MTDRVTSNLPSRDFHATIAFYGKLGFEPVFTSDDWIILRRGVLELEFFHHPGLTPKKSWFSACIRVADLDGLYEAFQRSSLSSSPRDIPRLTPIESPFDGFRVFHLVDEDGSLIRCIEDISE